MDNQHMGINSAKNSTDQSVLNNDNSNFYNLAEEAEKIRKAEISYAVEEATKRAIKRATKKATKKATKETTIKIQREIVQNMLRAKMDLSIIKKVTGLSEDVIKTYSI